MKNDKQHAIFILLAICLIVLALVTLTWCAFREGDDTAVTPTFAISETPSITPIPPTATATRTPFSTLPPPIIASPTATVVPATVSPGSGTAVTALTPPGTVTAVPPATPTPTETATGTATVEQLFITKGITYWDSAKAKYGRFECWQMLKAVNGWHERALPVGEVMRLPGECE